MLVNDVSDKPEIASTIIAELRESYGIKYRKEKKLKNVFKLINFVVNFIEPVFVVG